MIQGVSVSIILPVYNVERYLKPCLESLLNQTYRDFEIIAVNDGSTDGSLKLLKDFADNDTRIKIITQKNKGLSGARNTGLEHANGDYVLFVDSDDYVSPDLTTACVTAFENNDTDLVVFNHAIFNDGNETFTTKIKEVLSGPMKGILFLQKVLQLPTDTWTPACWYAYKKFFLDNYDLRFYEGILHEDVLFTPMALTHAKSITVLSEILYYYRKRAGSITTDPIKAEQSLKDYAFIAEQLYQFVMQISDSDKKNSMRVLLAKRYKFIIEECERQNSSFSKDIYSDVVKSLRKKSLFKRQFSESFYEKHIETSGQRQRRLFTENLMKWPRRIYNYKIRPYLK